jgi:endonuclease/exonuclease/phosphatase family metal-dependent hydrolase
MEIRGLSFVLFFVFMVFAFTMVTFPVAALEIKVISFNIRMSFGNDGVNIWENRKNLVISSLTKQNADFIGMQEVTSEQYHYLKENLGGYQSYAVGRKDGILEDEIMAIFYKPNYEILMDSTIWLSENPNVVGSKSWDAALYRTVSWIKVREKASGAIFSFFNTHFDHIGKVARANSAKLILKLIAENAGNQPVVLVGDFNTTDTDDPYKILTEKWKQLYHLKDARHISKKGHEGGDVTFNGFKDEGGKIIDFIFVSSGITVLEHRFLNIKEGDIFISDHYPVEAVLKLTGKKIKPNKDGKIKD